MGRIKRLGVTAATFAVLGCASAPAAPEDELARAMDAFVRAVVESEAAIRAEPAFGDDLERAAGYRHLSRAIVKGLQEGVFQDADFPYFRILDFWSREGGDNPDQRYAFAPIRGGVTYRVRGHLGSARRVELQLYAGMPWAGEGRSAGYLPFESIPVDADGRFEVWISPEPRAGAWLDNPADADMLFVRQIYGEWNAEDAGAVHIDRVGAEGDRAPELDAAGVAARLHEAARALRASATVWPGFVQQRYVTARPVNTVSPLFDTYALGGVRGRWMASGHFELGEGEALLIKTWPTAAVYQGLQLADLWFASLEYGNRTSSLTTEQALLSPDGAYYFVISREDPGHANWLDTGGLGRGVFLHRYDGVQGEIPTGLFPTANLVRLEDLPDVIPGFERVPAAERERVRAERRRHLQVRFGR